MRVLVVDDELSMREYLELLLAGAGHQVSTAPGVTEALASLEKLDPDLVISDMKLGRGSGLSVLEAARKRARPPEVILITAYGTPETAVQAMREGAYDYIRKPFDNEELKLLVQKALEKRALRRENDDLKRSLAGAQGGFYVGDSPAMQGVSKLIDKVAGTRSTVLVTGESGTGKELVARAIHRMGGRAALPFVPVNCAAIAESLLESELFGHVRGAFTGATHDRDGILVSAREGSVFLDEIGEISQSIQVKLLRVLQERMVRPVGGSQEVPFHARIIAATNKNLDAEVKAGRFREDLLYRLNVITVELPPLRSRPEDIPGLARLFLSRVADEIGRPNLSFSNEALEVLKRYTFPGNIRQLQNVVERAATLADEEVLGVNSLLPAVRGVRDAPDLATELGDGFNLERTLDEVERRYLKEAMARADGVKTRAAQLLGLTFRSFRYRMAKQGLAEDSGKD